VQPEETPKLTSLIEDTQAKVDIQPNGGQRNSDISLQRRAALPLLM